MALLPQDFKEFLRLLNAHGVEYPIVGEYAVGYYGYARATAGIDIWIAQEPTNAQRLVSVLHEFGFELEEVTPDLFIGEDRVIRMGVPPVRIEILTSASGVRFAECFANRCVAEIDGVPVNLIALPDLRRNKRAAGRHKDLDDIKHLPTPRPSGE